MFTGKQVVNTVLKLTKKRHGCENLYLHRDTTFESLMFDKHDTLYMILACEEVFGVGFLPEEVDTVKSIGDLISKVIGKLKTMDKYLYKNKTSKNSEKPVDIVALTELEGKSVTPIKECETTNEAEHNEAKTNLPCEPKAAVSKTVSMKIPTTTPTKEDTTMAGKFEIKKCANGKFMFNLKAANGEIILTSQQYKALAYAKKGIASVQKNAVEDRFEVKEAKNGEIFFVLKAKNAQVIGQSETYPTKAALEKGIASVIKNAADAKIVEA